MPAETKAEGLQWYAKANGLVGLLAEAHGVDTLIAAAVLAILSPNTSWTQSLIDADNVLKTWRDKRPSHWATVTTYDANKQKAFDLLTGAKTPEECIRGPKVRAFFHNLLGDLDAVTIDSHALNAWAGRRIAGASLHTPRRITTIRQCEADYRMLARWVEVKPAQAQAAIWCYWRQRNEVTR